MSQSSPVDQTTGNRLVFEESTEIQAPIAEVYRRWTDFPHFPEFMSNVQEVRPLGSDRYHWVARIFGTKQEWDAEVTDRDPNRRVAWRSLTGAYNAGTVSFSELTPTRTEVRVRMEYAPPGGQIGQALDKLTQVTRREVKEDLTNFKRVVSGEKTITGESQTSEGFGRVMASLAVPITTGIITGAGAWLLEQDLLKNRTLQKALKPVATASKVEPEAATAGWIFAGLSGGSVIASAILRSQGQRNNSLFVGQWAPTLLQFGLLSRLIGRRGLPLHPAANAASYAFAGAAVGSVVTSALTHVRGTRSDGLFIGQWAPTFLGLSLLMRLLNR